jgi:hypothetical protein
MAWIQKDMNEYGQIRINMIYKWTIVV